MTKKHLPKNISRLEFAAIVVGQLKRHNILAYWWVGRVYPSIRTKNTYQMIWTLFLLIHNN
jgi:hypothetical protein